uniref:TorF family putative porin n=1 Tax=uncultured Sphingomonas sp. TaxID=158754 RepID=UPI0035C9B872
MTRLSLFAPVPLLAALVLAAPAAAQEAAPAGAAQTTPDIAAPAAAPAITLAGSASLVSEYRFRGISQSDGKIAIQGGLAATLESGFYVSTWGSNLGGFGTYGGANLELDLIGGYKHSFGHTAVDGGLLYYVYPGTNGHDYAEPYFSVTESVGPGALKAGVAYAPKQRAIGNKDSVYVYGEASAPIAHTPFTLRAHVGHTDGDGATPAGPTGSYTDYAVGSDVTYRMLTLNLSYVGSDVGRRAADAFYTGGSLSGHKITRGTLVAALTASF